MRARTAEPNGRRWPGWRVGLAVAMVVAGLPAAGVAGQTADSIAPLDVTDVVVGTARLGENTARVVVHNPGEDSVFAVVDLRAEPGPWMVPNVQTQTPVVLGPDEAAVVEAPYRFQRMSVDATLRVLVGPGARATYRDQTISYVTRADYREIYPVGRSSPDAYDPAADFIHVRRGSLDLWAWRGSRAESEIETIAANRGSALRTLADLLDVEPPDRVRLVFYADAETKREQTGHTGVGWATGTTLVEVYNDSVGLDPYHELAHIVAKAAGSPPAVLDEGFAVYAAFRLGADALAFVGYGHRAPHRVVCALRSTGMHVPLAELLALDEIGSRQDRAPREYAEAGSLVQYLVEAHGLDRFRLAYGRLGGDHDNATVLGDLYGASIPDLERAWLRAACDG